MSEPYDPRRSVSTSLTEVRTALSRAKSAKVIIEANMVGGRPWHNHPGNDEQQMLDALNMAIKALEPWERKGNRSGRGGRSA